MDLSEDGVVEFDEDVESEMFAVDLENQNDPQSCTEYVTDIYRFLHQSQRKYACPDYLKTQSDITANMTGILMDWLVEVAEEYHLTNETLHLCKHYIDRYLACQKVTRANLQLVGVSAMLIASKFEEIFPPGVDDFVYISDNTFTKNQVIETETNMLNMLKWDLTNPTTLEFIRRYSRITNADPKVVTLSKFLSELALMDYNMVQYLPSQIALACLTIANHSQSVVPPFHFSLQMYVGMDEKEALRSCVSAVHKLWLNASKSKLQAVRTKYERTRNQKVATLKPPATAPSF